MYRVTFVVIQKYEIDYNNTWEGLNVGRLRNYGTWNWKQHCEQYRMQIKWLQMFMLQAANYVERKRPD